MPEKKLTSMHPADAAAELEELAREEALKKLRQLDPDEAAEPLEAMDPWDSSRYVEDLTAEFTAEILANMHPDDSVDILQELPSSERNKILRNLDLSIRKTLQTLLEYSEDTAGGMMTPEVLALPEEMTISRAIEELRNKKEELENLHYTFITDDQGTLTGVLPLRELAFRDPSLILREIMNTEVMTIHPGMDREEVARTFDKYDYVALPVVDDDDHLLGIVTVDDVIDVLRQEDTEDMLGMVGVSEAREESIWTPWPTSLKHRLPWLVINLGTALMAAVVVGFYESTIEALPVLAVFMPVIAGQGGNSGSQTIAILVRSIAVGDIRPGQGFGALVKESWLGLVHGLTIAIIVGIIAFFWKSNLLLAITVGAAMVLSMITAGVAGVAIPLGLQKLGVDPALSSTIWMTTITDLAGFFFLLGLATWLLV
mgnify:CR=1 FL=1